MRSAEGSGGAGSAGSAGSAGGDVVLTGLSGRLPESGSIEEFAQQLFAGVDLVTADDRRWTPGLHGLPERSGKLKDLSRFDASYFRVNAKQADAMDPQLRMLLELTHEAVVDAGFAPAELRGSRTGVFVGAGNLESEHAWLSDVDKITGYEVTGCCRAMFANRLSYTFDFKGPSYTLGTACSSSMYALAHAVAAIRAGDCDAAVVAGVNLGLKPEFAVAYQRLGLLSPEGRCATFDASGRGYVRSEAVVALLVQRRRDARRLYCTVRGAQVNNDGHKVQSITYPSSAAQSCLARETFEEAGLRPQDVDYFEAHGTGTRVGDRKETNAIAELFCAGRPSPLLIGSVKSNMGHSEAASGLCAIAKVVLAMERGVIPGNLHYCTPHPSIPALSDGRIKVVDRNTPWGGGLVAVNSFGFGGANAHVILESHAGAGVGSLGLVDYDTVSAHNLHRQLLHAHAAHAAQPAHKAHSAAAALARLNPHITITPYNLQLDSSNALGIVSKYDVVLDCTDNMPTRYLLNDACVITKVPLISGSALKMEGQITIYGYRERKDPNEKEYRGPCYRCLFPTPPPPETVGSCSADGVAGPVPGLIGVLQALEAIKLIVGHARERLLVERMVIFDGEDATFRNVKLRPRNPQCAVCSAAPTITTLVDYEVFCRAKAKEKKKDDAKIKSQRRKEEKKKRMSGQSYYGFRKDADQSKWVQDVFKSERKMGPPCVSQYCSKGTSRKCVSFNNEIRQKIFDYFWNELDWNGKKNFVRALVDNIPPKRRRIKHKGEVSRKGDSKQYNLFLNDQKLPVCRTTFLNTLGIKEAMVRCWLLKENKVREAKKPLKALSVENYIDNLPKINVKCTYCKNIPMYSNLVYLDVSHIKNQYQLYHSYVRDMKVKGELPASRKTFSKVFLKKNLKIFKPKNESDVCDVVGEHNMSYGVEVDSLNLDLGQNVMSINYTPQW